MDTNKTSKKLLLIGSTSNPVHVRNFYLLVKDYFDEVVIVGTHKVDFCTSYAIDFGIKNPFKIISSIRQLRKLMLDFNPSIVHVHQANSFGYISALANKRRFPMVLTTWGDDVLILPKINFIYKKLVTTSLKYADAITADAEIMKTAIHSFYGNVPVEIANFGIDILNIEIPQKDNVIYSNRLHDDLYNIDLIISGTKKFLHENPDWKLIIAAVGKNTEKLKQLVKELKLQEQVEFVGFLDKEQNLNNYLRSKIYISIPNTDGTSISLLEAMAYGCLPVLSDLPANREWVKDAENGIILEGYQVENGLERVFMLDAEKAIKMNQEIIENKATKEVNYLKFIAIYEKILKR